MADNTKQRPTWLGEYPVLDEDHLPDLEAAAAVHEFRGRLPRQVAERRAHEDYVRDQALTAAAHHLLGARAAHHGMNPEAARQHGEAYSAAMRLAGYSPMEEPPKEVLDRVQDAGLKVYSFKKHPADCLYQPIGEKASADDVRVAGLMDRLRALRDAAAGAAKTEGQQPEVPGKDAKA